MRIATSPQPNDQDHKAGPRLSPVGPLHVRNLSHEIARAAAVLADLRAEYQAELDAESRSINPYLVGDWVCTPGTIDAPTKVLAVHPRSLTIWDERLKGRVRIPLTLAIRSQKPPKKAKPAVEAVPAAAA